MGNKHDFIANYMNKQLKKNKLPYGMQYLNWFADKEEKAEKLYKAHKKRQTKKNNMKTQEEIEQLAIIDLHNRQKLGHYELADLKSRDYYYDGFTNGYTQCQKDNDWTKDCKCESSIGQTWCCNQCGLPYDTRKSDKKYTDEDMINIVNKSRETGLTAEYLILQLNKQD